MLIRKQHGAFQPTHLNPFTVPESIQKGIGFLMSMFWVFLFLIVLWRIASAVFNWLRIHLTRVQGVKIEPMSGAFKADISALLKIVFEKLLSLGRVLVRWAELIGKKRQFVGEATSTREIYRELLKWGSKAECPRNGTQTPNEYLLRLIKRFPEAESDLTLITTQYMETRYGFSIPSPDQLEQLKQKWRRIKRMKK